MTEQIERKETMHSIEKKQPLYLNKIDNFERGGGILGRKIVIFEKMLYFHRDITHQADIRREYRKRVNDLLCSIHQEPENKHYSNNAMKIPMDNAKAFEQFKEENLHNPEFAEKYIAFVNGFYQDVSEKRTDLVKKVYDEFGNVEMFVGKISTKKYVKIIDTPEIV